MVWGRQKYAVVGFWDSFAEVLSVVSVGGFVVWENREVFPHIKDCDEVSLGKATLCSICCSSAGFYFAFFETKCEGFCRVVSVCCFKKCSPSAVNHVYVNVDTLFCSVDIQSNMHTAYSQIA